MKMAVKKVGEKYRCNICGNEVTVTKVGGGTLVCCDQNMELVSSEGRERASGK
jgi:desulfoferrodoxin-like iron-binding protein